MLHTVAYRCAIFKVSIDKKRSEGYQRVALWPAIKGKKERLTLCAADPEQMGRKPGVSLTYGSYQNSILICEMPK